MPITIAEIKDIPQLVALMNSAYRGDISKKGWTTEADLLKGDLRTDEETVNKLMSSPTTVFLKFAGRSNKIEGSVFLDKQDDRLYLGMLSVSPLSQAKGIGKQLMAAAYDHATKNGCRAIFMKVISVRHELIAWYERQGFYKTGVTEPFPVDERFGIPTQPLEFVIMEKAVSY